MRALLVAMLLFGVTQLPEPAEAQAPCVSLGEVLAIHAPTLSKWQLEGRWGVRHAGSLQWQDKAVLIYDYRRCGHLAGMSQFYVEVVYLRQARTYYTIAVY